MLTVRQRVPLLTGSSLCVAGLGHCVSERGSRTVGSADTGETPTKGGVPDDARPSDGTHRADAADDRLPPAVDVTLVRSQLTPRMRVFSILPSHPWEGEGPFRSRTSKPSDVRGKARGRTPTSKVSLSKPSTSVSSESTVHSRTSLLCVRRGYNRRRECQATELVIWRFRFMCGTISHCQSPAPEASEGSRSRRDRRYRVCVQT